ncbi:DEAD/DEAH box helicase [Mucisphaera sp.]|uniref:DEAD/DEAH box helicase n=1 Tax=Mucisphaera sp. TaxID=2913024 RepID=UPI003D14889E
MSDLFDESVRFADLGLSDEILAALSRKGFEHPTLIQAQLIPPILKGKDVMGQAKTGSGKTAAFALPVIEKADPEIPMQALVLAPTRELAVQVAGEIEKLAEDTPIKVSCIIGGESMRKQQQSMEAGGHIIVGTPGRIMDLHGRRQLRFDRIRFAVLDEVDRMLDIGFRDDIRQILKQCPDERQTIFVSATISEDIERLGRRFMKEDAEKIVTVGSSLTVSMVDQKYFSVEPWDKRTLLLYMIRQEKPETTVVFCKTKATVHKVTQYLREKGVAVREIHGDLHQSKRTKVMNSLRQKQVDVLIASDLAARGLDIDHITDVVNYDLPEDPEVYIHRIGRTARAGRRGRAWSFVTPEEGQRLTDIEKLSGALIEPISYEGFKPGPIPAGVQAERDQANRTPEKADRGPVDPNALSPEQLAVMFPGGVVPKGKPVARLGSRLRRRGR